MLTGSEVARLKIDDVKGDITTNWCGATTSIEMEEEAIVFGVGKNSRTVVGTCIGSELMSKLKLLMDPQVRKRAGILQSNKFVFASVGSDDHVSGTSEIRELCKEIGLQRPVGATSIRHYVATLFPRKYTLKDSEKSTYYGHFGHTEKINQTEYQCFPAVEEIKLVKKIRTIIHEDSSNIAPTSSTATVLAETNNTPMELTHDNQHNYYTDKLVKSPIEQKNSQHSSMQRSPEASISLCRNNSASSCDEIQLHVKPSSSRKLNFSNNINMYDHTAEQKDSDGFFQPENDELNETCSESPVLKKSRQTLKLQPDESSSESSDEVVSKKRKKMYRKWSTADSKKIKAQFKKCIRTKVFKKPSYGELKTFVKTNKLDFFVDRKMTPQKCTELLRKLYNENRLYKEKVQTFEGGSY